MLFNLYICLLNFYKTYTMKKFFTLIIILIFSYSSYSQESIIQKKELFKNNKSFIVENTSKKVIKSSSAPIWSEDFSSGIPSTWTGTGSASNGTSPLWVYRGPSTTPGVTVGSQGAYMSNQTPIASATQNNGFIIFDSDYYDNNGSSTSMGLGQHPAPHEGMLKTDMIDLTGYGDVTLYMHSYFRTFMGQAFVNFYVNGTFVASSQVHSDLAVNDASPTDDYLMVRLPSSVCNNPNVQMEFDFDGITQSNANGSGYYFWMIDDLELVSTPGIVLEVLDANHGGWESGYSNPAIGPGMGFGIDYTFKPMDQSNANPYLFELKVANAGAKPIHGIKMNVLVTDVTQNQVFVSSSDTTTLAVLDTVTYLANQSYAPMNYGPYNINFWASSDSISYTDSITMQAIITDTVYGRDYNSPDGSWRVGRSCGGLQLLNIFDVYAQDEVTSISAHIADFSNPGTDMYGILYEVDTFASPWSFIQLDITDDYEITPQDLDQWVTIMFNQPNNLIPGIYAVAVAGYPNPVDTFGISTSGDAEVLMSRIQDNGCNLGSQPFGYWYYITSTPMIRMNFGAPKPPSGVEYETFGKVRVFPNPANDQLSIYLENKIDEKITISLSDVLGKTVDKFDVYVNMNLTKTLDLSNYNKGVYLLEIKGENKLYSEKVIIE